MRAYEPKTDPTPAALPPPSVPGGMASDGVGKRRVTGGHDGYRTDIDGLRAIAVLPILFNHAGVRGFGGGYVGVDIFFIISGFLITGILMRDIGAGRFSIAEFYRRRILRIFPALFAMLAIVSVVAVLAMMPGELVRYAHSVMATTFFGSNILFYSEVDYFDAAAHAKPLLHTWSLGIEEQFYILWPLLLAWIGTARAGLLRATLIGVCLLSFAVSIVMLRADISATFYLLPSRVWELGMGGLLAVFTARVRVRWINEALAVIGLGLIAYAIVRFFPPTPFPGPTALVPCLGAALLIFSGPDTTVGRLLSLWPMAFTGRISYSLYLWHWPVIVFAELWLFLGATPLVIAGEIALSYALAILSWRFVETPFRTGSRGWLTRKVLLSGGAAMAVSLSVAGALTIDDGLSSRFTRQQVAIDGFTDQDYEKSFRRGTCFLVRATDRLDEAACLTPGGTKPTLLVMGDSMAAHYWPGLSAHGQDMDVLQATMTGCRPILYPQDTPLPCGHFFRRMLTQWVPAHKPDLVLLTGNWRPWDMPGLTQTLALLRKEGVRVLVAGPVPQYRVSLPRLLVFAERNADPDLIRASTLPIVFETDRLLPAVTRRAGVPYFSVIGALCEGYACRTLAAPNEPMQFDDGHLAPGGSRVIADLMMGAIRDASGGTIRSR